MILYHFTAGGNLRGIHHYGLTVGDVPTDLDRNRGRVGVWFTSAEAPYDHGLYQIPVDKHQFRLSVEIPDDSPLLVKWTEWAPGNVTAVTMARLHNVAPTSESWWVYFGVIKPSSILSCHDVYAGKAVDNWGDVWPVEFDIKAVPPWYRQDWHRNLLKKVARAMRQQSAM